MKTLKDIITARYGAGTHCQFKTLSRLKTRLASAKNHILFLERCKSCRITPTFLRNRCPIKSARAHRITRRYRQAILKETLHLERKKWHRTLYQTKNINQSLKQRLTEEHFSLVKRLSDSSFERTFKKTKEKLCRKFDNLENQLPKKIQPRRPSTIKNPLLQLQKDNPLPP